MARKIRALALALCLSVALGGCSTLGIDFEALAQEEDEGTYVGDRLVLGYAADAVFSLNYDSSYSFNPITGTSTDNRLIMPLIYDSMVVLDENFSPQPGLITAWESEDGQNWTLTVAEGRTFHDGSAVTAADVYESLLRCRGQGIYVSRLSGIAGISITGDYTLAVALYSANYDFPALLGDVPVVKSGTSYDNAPVGCGMYQLILPQEEQPEGDAPETEPPETEAPETEAPASETPAAEEALDAGPRLVAYSGHPDYGRLPVDTIYLKEYRQAADIISAFEDSLVDLVLNDPLGMDNLGYGSSNEIRYFNTTNMHYLGFNALGAFTQYPSLRQALTYAVHRSAIVTDIMNGCATAATLPLSPLSTRYNASYAQYFDYSLENCRTALELANVQDYDRDGLLEQMLGGEPVDITLRFLVNSDSAVKVAAARKIAEDLESVGITVELQELTWEAYLTALQEGNFDIYYAEVKLAPDFDIASLILEDGALNYGNIYDPNYSLYRDAMRAAPENERQMQADLYYQYLAQTAPIIPICFERQQVLTHRNVIADMSPTQGNVFYNFTEWTMNLSGE